MKEITLKTSDNIKIAVNYHNNNFREAVIIAPGWFMTKDSKSFKEIADYFSTYADVLSMDFRGHGKSSGFYTFTSKEINDINAVIEYAKDKYENIYLVGFSLGAAIVLIAAENHKNIIKKVIAVSAPTCFEKIENQVWKKEAWIPTFKKCELNRWFSIRPGKIHGQKTRPIDIVDKIESPTLFLAGEKDPTVYPWHTKALFDKAVCEKKYELFKDCCHAEDLFIQNRDKFTQICTTWLFTK